MVLCVGETLEERESGKLETVLSTQLREGLAGVAAESLDKVTIAYEPVWRSAPEKPRRPTTPTRSMLTAGRFSPPFTGRESQNDAYPIRRIGEGGQRGRTDVQTNIDGALVGGASLKAESFVPIACFR